LSLVKQGNCVNFQVLLTNKITFLNCNQQTIHNSSIKYNVESFKSEMMFFNLRSFFLTSLTGSSCKVVWSNFFVIPMNRKRQQAEMKNKKIAKKVNGLLRGESLQVGRGVERRRVPFTFCFCFFEK